MTLRDLRLGAISWIRRPLGQLAGMLLLVALVFAGAPMATLHAHEGGSRDHSHDAVASVVAHPDPDHHDQDHHREAQYNQDRHGDPDSTGGLSDDTVLHLHDVGTLVLNLPSVPALALPQFMLASIDANPPAIAPPTAARTPPHRPPIA